MTGAITSTLKTAKQQCSDTQTSTATHCTHDQGGPEMRCKELFVIAALAIAAILFIISEPEIKQAQEDYQAYTRRPQIIINVMEVKP